jgi:GTP pyrophosphokinase
MVKLRENYQNEATGFIEPEIWLRHIGDKRKPHEHALIRQAYSLAQLSGSQHPTFTGESCLQQGLGIADILDQLELDVETIIAALIFPSVQYSDLSLDDIEEQLTTKVANLVDGVIHMDAIRTLHSQTAQLSHHRSQLDNLRKMLLAMVEDVRVVLIKLAERTLVMRRANVLGPTKQKEIAQEINDIYAPLANRLGIGQLKWELEDLAFRYLEVDTYKKIASSVDQKRVDREKYISEVISEIKIALAKAGIHNFKITGRAKHIYSIYRKMQRKEVGFNKIYDASAVRILVPSIENCYAALGVVHSLWPPIPEEFDDYVAHPKPNGYRSLHTAVVGPQQKNVEVQIRTHAMHQESELGVAAHWIYKEGGGTPSSYDQKIAWLRQILEWQKELSGSDSELGRLEAKIFEDRVYVFTPNSEIIDLPIGSTPLDFAYNIHTQIGHRCRGAKIDGHIVPLTYELKTGDRVEILTAKHPNPSRDWLNPNLHYLKTNRAKAKIHHWFKQQDYDKNRHEGHEILMRELRRLNVENIKVEELAEKFSHKSADDFLAAIGAGDIRIGQLLHVIESIEQNQQQQEITEILPTKREFPRQAPSGITVEGVGNLLTTVAKCCNPIPGDPIIGYITQGRGVSIHRQDCLNILSAGDRYKERLIDIHWGEQRSQYPVDIFVKAYDRYGLVRDITTLLAHEKININVLTSTIDKQEHTAHINLTIEIPDLNALSRIFDRIMQLSNVISVERQK